MIDLWGDLLPVEIFDGKSNPRMLKKCKHHGWDYFTSHFSTSKNKTLYECPSCHDERGVAYRKRKKETGGTLSDLVRSQMFKIHREQKLSCPVCNRYEHEIDLYKFGRTHPWHVDHIDPNGGNSLSNLRIICQECNTKKNNKTEISIEEQRNLTEFEI